jgi:AraC family transcriptional regulator
MPRRSSTEDDYVTRIDRVIDHIHAHYAEPLPLPSLARVAHFSPYHFHRVFRAHTGETLRAFVARVRVQRAALLLGRGMTKTTLIEVALSSGFGSAAELSRAFRETFDVSPSAFRRAAQTRKNAQEPSRPHAYLPRHERSAKESPLRVELVRRPASHVAYVRVQNPFADAKLSAAAARLDAYARAHGLETRERLGLSLDDPELTPPSRTRYELAVLTDDRAPVAGGISRRVLEGGHFAELRAVGGVADVARAWDRLFTEWLPGSGYEPGDGPGLERYLAPPDFDTWSGFDVVLALPLRRARHAR